MVPIKDNFKHKQFSYLNLLRCLGAKPYRTFKTGEKKMHKIFYFLMVFFSFSAVQVGAQDGKGTADAPGFKVDGANMMGDAICPKGGCDSARGTDKARGMEGKLDSSGAAMPETLVRPTGVAPIVAPGLVAPGMAPMGEPHCGPGQVKTPGVGCRDM
jgi:hypothetical protein